MGLFSKSKERTVTAIVIEKFINNQQTDSEAIRKMIRMRYGMSSNKRSSNRHYIRFKTEKRIYKFLVEQTVYQQIKLNALGELTTLNDQLISFKTTKIATKKDVELLNWK